MMTKKLKFASLIGTVLFLGSIPFAVAPYLLPFTHIIALLVSWSLFTLGTVTLFMVIWHSQPTLPKYSALKKPSGLKKFLAGISIIVFVTSIPFLFMPSALPVSSSIKINTFIVWSTFFISITLCFAVIWEFANLDVEQEYKAKRKKDQIDAMRNKTLEEQKKEIARLNEKLKHKNKTNTSKSTASKKIKLADTTNMTYMSQPMQYPKDRSAAKDLKVLLKTFKSLHGVKSELAELYIEKMKQQNQLSHNLFELDLDKKIFKLSMELNQLKIDHEKLTEKDKTRSKIKTLEKKIDEARTASADDSESWAEKEQNVTIQSKTLLVKLQDYDITTTAQVISDNRYFYAPLPIQSGILRTLAKALHYGERMPFGAMIEQTSAWIGKDSQGFDTRPIVSMLATNTTPKNCQYSHDRADILNLYHCIVTDKNTQDSMTKDTRTAFFFGPVRTYLENQLQYQTEDFQYLWPDENFRQQDESTLSDEEKDKINNYLIQKHLPQHIRRELYETYSVTLYPRENIRKMLLKATPPKEQYKEIAKVQLHPILESIQKRFSDLKKLTWVFPPSILPQIKPKEGYFGLDAIRLVYNSANFAIWEVIKQFCAKNEIPVEYVDLSSQLVKKPLDAEELQTLIDSSSTQKGNKQESKEKPPFIKKFKYDKTLIHVKKDQRWTSRRTAYDTKPQADDIDDWRVQPSYISTKE